MLMLSTTFYFIIKFFCLTTCRQLYTLALYSLWIKNNNVNFFNDSDNSFGHWLDTRGYFNVFASFSDVFGWISGILFLTVKKYLNSEILALLNCLFIKFKYVLTVTKFYIILLLIRYWLQLRTVSSFFFLWKLIINEKELQRISQFFN